MREKWESPKSVPNFLLVSNFGRAKTMAHYYPSGKYARAHEYKSDPGIVGDPHVTVTYEDGVKRHFRLSRLVAEAYIGVKHGEYVVHINGDKFNNNVHNLLVVTDQVKYAKYLVSLNDFKLIRKLHAKGISIDDISEKLGLQKYVVGLFIAGKAYED